MSINKKMNMIGNILNSLFVLYTVVISINANAKLHGGLIAVNWLLILVTLAYCLFNWFGFTRFDRLKDKGWKIYFLVIGILSIIDMNVAGIFYILSFALKGAGSRQTSTDGKFFD